MRWRRAVALVAPVLLTGLFAPQARAAAAGDEHGGLLGFVQDPRGVPVAGAVVSLFGKGVGAAGLVTLSDSSGRFSLPSLPAGSYTLRALRPGQGSSPARRITVLPNRESQFTVSISAQAEAAAAAVAAAAADEGAKPAGGVDSAGNRRELGWLLRHKRRSVLEDGSAAPQTQGTEAPRSASLAPWLPQLGGTLEVVTHPESVGLGDQVLDGDSPAASLSALRLQGRFSDSGSWSLGGLMSESGTTSWRMAAEFVLDAGEHQIRAGSGYGTRMLRQPVGIQSTRDESVGAIFVQDRWQAAENVTATVAGRFSHVGFLNRTNYLDPTLMVEARPTPTSAVRATAWRRTLAPGGDLLMLSTLATAPSIALAALDTGLRAERAQHLEVSMEEKLGGTTLRAHTFFEDVRDHLGNTFQRGGSESTLRIFNAGRVTARGLGLTLERRFGGAVNGSLTYTYGHGARPQETLETLPRSYGALAFEEADFHDVVARLETIVAGSDTRLIAFYRVNTLVPHGGDERALTNTRFDLQLSQGLPFLGTLTHADWDLLLAVRNLYYEADEGAMLDEVAVVNPPTRVLGGIAVRF
jgi:hypothetical protein